MNILETERLIIREYSEADFELLFPILSDPVTMSYWPAPFTKEQVLEWLNKNISRYEDNGFGRWAIIHKQNQVFIGDCGIMLKTIEGKTENDLGYILHHEYWNQGLAYEAANACTNYAFDHLKLNRLCANMAIDHVRSQNVAQKLGMRLEKVFANEQNRNILTYLYSRTNS